MSMNKHTGACFAIALSAACLAPLAALSEPSDTAAIRALEARFAKAVVHKDVEAIMKSYSPDIFVFDVLPPRQYVGAAAYREDWKGVIAGFSGPIKFELTDLVVTTEGTVGYGHSIQHMWGTDPKGAPADLTVRVTDVYRKKAGAWRIVLEHVSVPVDLETGKPDMSSKP
jgi:ketosteroid isomerase-like protein